MLSIRTTLVPYELLAVITEELSCFSLVFWFRDELFVGVFHEQRVLFPSI